VARPGRSELLVTTQTVAQLGELKETLRLVDLPRRAIELRTELVLSPIGGELRRSSVTSALGRTLNEQPLGLATTIGPEGLEAGKGYLATGQSGLRIVPRLNEDDTVTMNATWNARIEWRKRGSVNATVARRFCAGALTVRCGATQALSTLTFRAADGTVVEATLFVTPRRLRSSLDATLWGYVCPLMVREFAVASEADPLLGAAADAIATDLAESARWEVLRRDVVQATVRETATEAPLSRAGTARLAEALGATHIVSVEIAALPRDDGAITPNGPVRLRARLLDARYGDVLAQVTEVAAPEGEAASDLEKAVRRAATAAGRQLRALRSPTATVIGASDEPRRGRSVLLNRGANDGIRPGTAMAVFRGQERVGQIAVISSEQDSAVATVAPGAPPLLPEDRARAILIEGIPSP
jgi:hypothetical protein